MPVDRTRYPADWHAIRARILVRSGGRCEWCGVPNHAVGYRDREGRFWTDAELDAVFDGGDTPPLRRIKIVLTTAHLGAPHADGRPGDKHDKMDCRDENLVMLCQRCHLRYDRDEHSKNAAATRRRKRVAAGQEEMPL